MTLTKSQCRKRGGERQDPAQGDQPPRGRRRTRARCPVPGKRGQKVTLGGLHSPHPVSEPHTDTAHRCGLPPVPTCCLWGLTWSRPKDDSQKQRARFPGSQDLTRCWTLPAWSHLGNPGGTDRWTAPPAPRLTACPKLITICLGINCEKMSTFGTFF